MQISEEKQMAILEIFGGFLGEDISQNSNGIELLLHIVKKLDFSISIITESTDGSIQSEGLKQALNQLFAIRNTLFYGSPIISFEL